MPIDPRFLSMMPTVIKVFKYASKDKYGKPSWAATSKSYRCRLSDEQALTRTAEGDNVITLGKAIIYGIADVTTDDRLELDDGTSPVIVSVDPVTDEDGPHHTVIRFGR